MAPTFLLLYGITNEKTVNLTQIDRIPAASRTSLQKHVPTTVYVSLGCGTCRMASLFTSLSGTAIPAIFSEDVLPACQHQLPQALAASLLKHIIIMPFQQALFHTTSGASPAISDALLITSAPLLSPFVAILI